MIYLLHRNPGPASPPGSSADPSVSDDAAPASGKAWTLNLAGATYPDDIASGRDSQPQFQLSAGLRAKWFAGLAPGFGLPARPGRECFPSGERCERNWVAGRFKVQTNDTGLAPRVVLRWKEADLQVAQTFTNGYAMKLEFGPVAAVGCRQDLPVPARCFQELRGRDL